MRKILLVGPVQTEIKTCSIQSDPILGQHWDEVWCVDGGVDQARYWGLPITTAAGDWDSLLGKLDGINAVSFLKNKSESDLALTLQLLKDPTAAIHAVGLTGGRPDHHWSSLSELAWHSRHVASLSAADELGRYWFVAAEQGRSALPIMKNSNFSVFTTASDIFKTPATLSLRGAEYNLDRQQLLRPSHGLSNIAVEDQVELTVHEGSVLVIAPR